MNTILSILLLIALTIAIICDIIRIFQFRRTFEEAKKNVKETICRAVEKAYKEWDLPWERSNPKWDNTAFFIYFRSNFEKYL